MNFFDALDPNGLIQNTFQLNKRFFTRHHDSHTWNMFKQAKFPSFFAHPLSLVKPNQIQTEPAKTPSMIWHHLAVKSRLVSVFEKRTTLMLTFWKCLWHFGTILTNLESVKEVWIHSHMKFYHHLLEINLKWSGSPFCKTNINPVLVVFCSFNIYSELFFGRMS